MSKYRVSIELNERWFALLGELSKDTEGFVWIEVEKESRVVRTDNNGMRFLGDD